MASIIMAYKQQEKVTIKRLIEKGFKNRGHAKSEKAKMAKWQHMSKQYFGF